MVTISGMSNGAIRMLVILIEINRHRKNRVDTHKMIMFIKRGEIGSHGGANGHRFVHISHNHKTFGLGL